MSPIIDRDDLPPTPDWSTEPREAVNFTRTEVKPACALCKQRLDGRGEQ